jgi:hypothetical protein
MKTLFSMSPFAQPGFVPAFTSPAPEAGGAALGQAQEDITGISRGIEDILKLVPAELLGTYQAQYADCQKKLDTGGVVGLVGGGKCLYDLYQALKGIVNPSLRPPAPLAAPKSFPVLPAAITAVGGIILVYGLTKI